MDDTRRFKSTEELAFANIGGTLPGALPDEQIGAKGQRIPSAVGGEQARLIQAQIDVAMLGAIEDARKPNPVTGFASAGTVRPAGAGIVHSGPRSTGWHDPGPLGPPGGATAQAAIEALAQSYQPHQPSNPEYRPGSKGKQS